jgi:hypothetical protein
MAQAIGFERTAKEHKHSPPSLTKVHGSREKQHLQAGVDRINTVIKELPERTRLACTASATHL